MRISENQLMALLAVTKEALGGGLEKYLLDEKVRATVQSLYDEILIQQNEIVDTSNFPNPTRDQYLRLVYDMFESLEVTAEDPEDFYGSPMGKHALAIMYPDRKDVNKPRGRKTTMPKSKTPFYYCEQCFHLHGRLKKMVPDEEGALICPYCQGEWKLNQGQARHVVSLKLQHYRALAEKLGILEIEEADPPCPTCTYFSEVPGEGCDMLHAPHRNCADFRETS